MLRIRLDSPITAKIATWKVILLDLSADGARIEHSFPLARGKQVALNFEYKNESVSVICDVVRCKFERHEDKVSYYSGLRFREVMDGKLETLRDIISDAVASDFEARRQHLIPIKK